MALTPPIVTPRAGGPARVRCSSRVVWNPVTTRTDASPATPDGYHIYTSLISGSYGAATLTVGGGTTAVSFRQLGTCTHNQTYYLRLTAFGAADGESAPSGELPYIITQGVVGFRR